jgi:hypothetical protein
MRRESLRRVAGLPRRAEDVGPEAFHDRTEDREPEALDQRAQDHEPEAFDFQSKGVRCEP